VDSLKQKEKVERLYALHHSGRLLVLPNIWDPLGATLLESLGYPAIATASAAVAYSNGYNDGEKIPFDFLLSILKRIVNSVAVPVTADIESGYADSDAQLMENIKQLIEAGIAGINIEDNDKKTNALLPVEILCGKIQLIKNLARDMHAGMFINARADVYTRGTDYATAEAKLEETIKRGLAYKAAGADCFFPIAIRNEEDMRKTVEQVKMPVNIITMPGIPELKALHEIGVARVSLGPSFLKIAIRSMRNLALELQNLEGLAEITTNEITSDYLKKLSTSSRGKSI